MKNVISLPSRKMKGTDGLQKSEAKQVLLSLSVICLIVSAVMINDSTVRSQRPIYIISDNQLDTEKLNRAIASAENSTSFRDIEWEHKLARQLAKENTTAKMPNATTDTITDTTTERAPSSVGSAVLKIDELRYGALAGKYSMVNEAQNPKLFSRIEYVASNDVADRPIFLDRKSFLKNYKELLSVAFEKFELIDKDKLAGKEVYRLFDANSHPVGEASFELDTDERLISMSIISREALLNK